MKILILGGDGMLGHQLLESYKDKHDVRVTLRRDLSDYEEFRLFNKDNSFPGIDVRSVERLVEVFSEFQPAAVINAVGIVKQRSEARDAVPSLELNSLLPHRLAVLCKTTGSRLVHLSTDCVFSGEKGNYTEKDESDAADLYGRTKYLGEVHDTNCITLRTSIIGLELHRKKSLIEWFLSQHGTIKGYTRAIYSGFTTNEIARVIEKILLEHTALSGLWHAASEPISKYELLKLLSEKLERKDINIIPENDFQCDRSLDASKLNSTINYTPPSWDEMLDELVAQIRKRNKEY